MGDEQPAPVPDRPAKAEGDEKETEATPPRSQLLVRQYLWFRATIDGMRELASAIEPHVSELDAFEPRVRSLVESTPLPPEKRERLAEALLESAKRASETASTERDDDEAPDEASHAAAGRAAEGQSSEEDGDEEATAVHVESAEVAFELLRGFQDARAAPRGPMLYGALLVQAVAAFESLIGDVYGQHFALHPNALDAQEKEFSLGELQEFDDISDARDALIGRKVDAFTQQGLADWTRWVSRTLKVTLEELSPGPNALNEIFQRRHIIVHSAGRVSRQYLARVDFGSNPEPAIGTPLPVRRTYLAEALDVLDVVGTLIALVAWQKWVPEERDKPAAQLGLVGYDLLTSESWTATRILCAKGRELLELPQSTKLQSCVNEWVAQKRQEGVASIAPEVERWDVSALGGRFRLARSALLDNLDEVFELLPDLVEQGEVTLTNIASWPLLQEAREDERSQSYLERFAEG